MLPVVLATRLFFVALTVLVIGIGVPLWQSLAPNSPPIFYSHHHVTGTVLHAWNRSDVQWYDDLARLRTGHGPANMAIVKHTAMNLLTRAKPITSFKNRRKKAGWNQDYLEKLIRRTA